MSSPPHTVLVVQPFFSDLNHAPVNALILLAMTMGCPESRIVFVAHPNHYEAVCAVMPLLRPRLQFRPTEVMRNGPPSRTRFRQHLAMLGGAIEATRPDCVLCLSIAPETLFAGATIRAMRRLPIAAILHGDLATATGWRSRDPRRRLFDYRSAIRVAVWAGLRFVVLEEHIRRGAEELGLLPVGRCDVWPHPIADAEWVHEPPPLNTVRPCLGFLGFARRQKGFDAFLEMLRAAPDRYEFRLVGEVTDAEYLPLPERLTMVPDLRDRTRFAAAVRAVDYACVFLDEHTYRLTSSGSVIDAMAALRPMIGPETAATRAMFGAVQTGYFPATPEALAALLQDGKALTDAARYRTFQDGLMSLRRGRTPAELVEPIVRTLDVMTRTARRTHGT
jgi:glycosyltransferase involved in cell wall biosynthesis